MSKLMIRVGLIAAIGLGGAGFCSRRTNTGELYAIFMSIAKFPVET